MYGEIDSVVNAFPPASSRSATQASLKILYHHRTVSKDGMDVHIREMINAFTALGHDVVMVAPELGDVQFGGDGGWVSAVRSRLPKFVGEFLEYLYNYHAYRHL